MIRSYIISIAMKRFTSNVIIFQDNGIKTMDEDRILPLALEHQTLEGIFQDKINNLINNRMKIFNN